MTEKERKFVDVFAELLNKEIGTERYDELMKKAYKKATGKEFPGFAKPNPEPCPLAPHCEFICHFFGINCEYRPCVT